VIARGIALVTLWVALQGQPTVGNVVGGLLVVACIEALFPMAARSSHRVHPLAATRFVARLLIDLIVSSWRVLLAVLAPRPDRTHTEVVNVQLSTQSRLVASMVANAISLTPGTLTVDIEPAPAGYRLGVHVLGTVDPETFRTQMSALERRVVAAVTPKPSEPPEQPLPVDPEVAS
jgi:multicomponent Na+:H+ antiporter subunit E